MAKFKVGDVVKPLPSEDGYLHPHLIAGRNYTIEGYTSEDDVNVAGEFRENGDGRGWDEDWFEIAESEASAEFLRNSILDIRSKREALQEEILRLDEQEKEAVEKLKRQGFVLYEDNVSKELDVKELVATEKKTVLYAYEIEEDMTDPENWEIGDLVEAIYNSSDSAYRAGEVYEISWLQWRSVDDCVVSTSLDSNECSTNGWGSTNFKFHSRPVK